MTKTILSLLFFCFLIPVLVGCGGTETITTADISVAGAIDEVNAGKAVLLDVREESEWDEKHFDNALLIPMSSIKADDTVLDGLDRSTRIYTHCAKGKRAASMAELLREKGFDAVALEVPFEEIQKSGAALAGQPDE